MLPDFLDISLLLALLSVSVLWIVCHCTSGSIPLDVPSVAAAAFCASLYKVVKVLEFVGCF